ncbi:MAG TPA: alkene reductase [Polyangiaceae bacterium]|nr:alkene reductase [Polyangiaceae bacterium]
MTHSIFQPYQLGDLQLQNRIAMCPMTRCRADAEHAPTALVAEYYEQRASAGLIITEGVAPSPSGKGYARIPGLWSEAQVAGFAEVTRRVHARGAKIFAQIMHTGRVSHPLNMPAGTEVIAPSAVPLTTGKMWTDQEQMQDYPTPRAMTLAEVERTVDEHVVAAKNAIRAGFDGVELHGANGYLTEQFLNANTNLRTDRYGGSVENRARFALEVLSAMASAIGKQRVGVRFSPYGVASGMSPYPEVDATYAYLADELTKLGIVYVHVVDHSAQGAPPVPAAIKATIRERFKGTLIAAGGFELASAERAIDDGSADLVAFGRPFLANPDLVSRLVHGQPLAAADMATAFSMGPKGYTDYPTFGA